MGPETSSDRSASPVVGILLAGGTGSRFGGVVPKQLLDLGGKPVLHHALVAFERSKMVDALVLVANPSWRSEIEDVAADALKRTEFTVVDGGGVRNESVENAIGVIAHPEAKVLLHDGVRPLVRSSLIHSVIDALDHNDCVLPVTPSADPLVSIVGSRVDNFLSRGSTLRGQSPQGFWLTRLRSVFQNQAKTEIRDTVFEVLMDHDPDLAVGIVEGNLENIKVTVPIDATIARALLAEREMDDL